MCGVADMKLLDFNVRLSDYVLNLRRLLSIVIRCASLFGVGGSGRSPVSGGSGEGETSGDIRAPPGVFRKVELDNSISNWILPRRRKLSKIPKLKWRCCQSRPLRHASNLCGPSLALLAHANRAHKGTSNSIR